MDEGTSSEEVAVSFLSQYMDRPQEEIALMQITRDLAHLINAIVLQSVVESHKPPEDTTWH
jgi:hypothetical protein|tara:strand:+ start:2548 stop:2730 length:183 start_codon:yes stop_codon:yes gene_type:complete